MDEISVIFICISILTVFIGVPTFCICCRNGVTNEQYNIASHNGKYIAI